MDAGAPSRTALMAAVHRALHQLLEQGQIFADPLATRIVGDNPELLARDALAHPNNRLMHQFIAIPSTLTFVPVDLEQQTLAKPLPASGMHRSTTWARARSGAATCPW